MQSDCILVHLVSLATSLKRIKSYTPFFTVEGGGVEESEEG